MRRFIIIPIYLLVLAAMSGLCFGQQHSENSADKSLRGSGRVNASSLGMEIDIPLGGYAGRGINIPIGLSYSSKLWRIDFNGSVPRPGGGGSCVQTGRPEYAEDSAAGWTTSMAAPFIEYTGKDNLFDYNGIAISLGSVCGEPEEYNFVKRIIVHLPGGETHELRADDIVRGVESPPDVNTQSYWNTTYYATDGSNIRYIEDSTTGLYQLQMTDGSKYDFSSSGTEWNDKSIRKASSFADRNGNSTTYHGPDPVNGYPNGYWTDTIGRQIPIPIQPEAPTSPTVQTYSMPGLGGTTTVDYQFHWKKLKDTTEAESALTDFGQTLKYTGQHYASGSGWGTHSSFLFGSDLDQYVRSSNDVFNPIVLTEVELPTGESYKFSYDIYGRIERIFYPTGGKEAITYGVVPTLSTLEGGDVNSESNFGVIDRKVYPLASSSNNYNWTYSADYEAPAGYKVTINNPNGTKVERFLHRGFNACSQCQTGQFGYDNGLAGMAYKELSFDSSGVLISQKLTHWEETLLDVTIGESIYPFHSNANWHPRITEETTYSYDPSGNGDSVSSTVKYEYEGNLALRDNPLLMKRTTQYAFVADEGGESIAPSPTPGDDPAPYPTPIPTPEPPTPVRIMENTFLINDSAYSSVKANYTDQNLMGLITATEIQDGAETVVKRSETIFDESGRSPGYRGNPTTARVWDSTKGSYSNTSAYISTHAKFDSYGNQYETTDALGRISTTTFDGTYHTFPIEATSPIPDVNGVKGSATAFKSYATFDPTTGLALTTIDANDLKTEITYDSDTLRPLNTKNYIGSTQVGGTSETIYHDESGDFWVKNRSQIDNTNWAESITYFDGLGRAYKSEKVDTGGNIFVEKEFDADGRVYRVTNPFRADETKQWTTNVYDDASRVKEVILPDGAKVKTDYAVASTDKIGITKQITDQAGKKRKGITDSLGRMIRVIEDPSGQNLNTDYVFDTLGNLRKTIQGEQSRYFMHDSLGRLLYAKQPEQEANTSFTATDPITSNTSWSVKYEYDDNGNILKATNAEGVYVQATYDGLNRITERDYSDSTPDVEFYYDGKGLPAVPDYSIGKTTKVTSSLSETRYKTFDEFGRLLTHEQRTTPEQLAGTEDPYPTAYEYYLSGALIEETYPSGRKVKNVLDNDGALSIIQSKKDASHGYWNYADNISYNTSGAVEKMQLGNGRWETATYNNRQQITQIGLGETDDDQDLLNLEYDYGTNTENNGSMREQTITVPTVGSTSGFTAVQDYDYDGLNRLTSAEENVSSSTTWKQTFTYDRYGNRRFDTTSGLTTTLGSCTETICNPHVSTATNRFTTTGYTYDKNGNLTTDAEGKRYSYDAENHQKEYFSETNSTSTPDATYFYDGEGKRIKKVSDLETTIFVYDGGGQLVAEYSTQTAQTPRVSYLTNDHLGSPRLITDENGDIVERKDYTAFGEESISEERVNSLGYTGDDELRKGYTGYEKDGESGLNFAQARYYNSGHGRYTSVDPLTASASILNPQTFNRYSYVLNSPYKFSDPLGLLPIAVDGSGIPRPDPIFDNGEGRRSSDSGWRNGWQMADEAAALAALQSASSQTNEGIAFQHESLHAQAAEPPGDEANFSKMVEDSTGIGNANAGSDGLYPAFYRGHDGVHNRTSKDGAKVSVIKPIEGKVIYVNIQESAEQAGINTYTVHIRTNNGYVVILKDLITVSSEIKKLGMGGKAAYTGKNITPTARAVTVRTGDFIGTVNSPIGLHFAITTLGNYPRAHNDIQLKTPYDERDVEHVFIDPCGSSSPVNCK